MPSVAEQLRHAREQQKRTVYDIAEATKIRTDHIRALDEGAYHVFPAPIYIRGFVRTYATLLKLDVPRIMQDLEAELSQTKQFREPPNLTKRSEGVIDVVMLRLSKLNWHVTALIVGVGLLVLLGTWSYRAWRIRQTADPLAGLSSGLYQPPTNSGEVLPLPSTNSPK